MSGPHFFNYECQYVGIRRLCQAVVRPVALPTAPLYVVMVVGPFFRSYQVLHEVLMVNLCELRRCFVS